MSFVQVVKLICITFSLSRILSVSISSFSNNTLDSRGERMLYLIFFMEDWFVLQVDMTLTKNSE